MAQEHYDMKCEVLFMGKHPSSIDADIDWDETNHGTVTGTADMKMMKTIKYPIGEGSSAIKNPDGSIHVDANLPSHFGNGALKCALDMSSDGSITGRIPLLKGAMLTMTGNKV